MLDKKSFIELYKEEHYRKAIVDALCQGVDAQYIPSFKSLLEYVITKYDLFDRDEFKGALYLDEDETLDLILPAVRRVFGKVFMDPPKIFVVDPQIAAVKGYKEDGRLELFRMHYDIDEFLDYLVTHLLSSKDILSQFDHIDKAVTTLEIIVDNYIAGIVKKVLDSDDIKRDIRDLKIKKMIEND
jgi:hypothetical protein